MHICIGRITDDGVRLFRAEPGAGETSRNETSERIEGLGPVHVVRVKVRVERPDDGRLPPTRRQRQSLKAANFQAAS